MSDPLRILVVQNHYVGFGGDDVVVANESSLLSAKGHEVSLWSVHNKDLTSLRSYVHTALNLTYSRDSKAQLSRHIAARIRRCCSLLSEFMAPPDLKIGCPYIRKKA